ncbi:uncharacterized protein LOC129807244 [Phlebotomus papatasi]|uniref:uncharacterized protein LOC129807244 n=1 Tax=Phlebotomus papatasi TaxID=29031 RepID=UPI0024845AE5|nr:uncharacterized protein LOC129807244 [Phlebotomus papatasi]
MGRFLHQPNYSPFLIGIYEGQKDPKDATEFLEDLTNEINHLNENGVFTKDGKHFHFQITSYIMDSKARASITGVKGHTSHKGCGRCEQHGISIQRRVVFSQTCGQLRTDDSFAQRRDSYHHNEEYPYGLEVANVKMISQVPLCSMHLIYLGIVRTLGVLWMTAKSKTFTLSPQKRKELDKKHMSLTPFLPTEFSRKPDSLYFVHKWKATQCRQFLLYTGPVNSKNKKKGQICQVPQEDDTSDEDLPEQNAPQEETFEIEVFSSPKPENEMTDAESDDVQSDSPFEE